MQIPTEKPQLVWETQGPVSMVFWVVWHPTVGWHTPRTLYPVNDWVVGGRERHVGHCNDHTPRNGIRDLAYIVECKFPGSLFGIVLPVMSGKKYKTKLTYASEYM